jgi:Ca2+-binding RTX toxin-like protein
MAKVISNVSVNLTALNFNFYVANFKGSDFGNDVNQTYLGKAYRDWFLVNASDQTLLANLVAAGDKLTVSKNGEPNGGTANLIIEAVGNAVAWSISGVFVAFKSLYQAAVSADRADDTALLRSALSGNDKFNLSGSNDVVSGFAGNDVMRGNSGSDLLLGGKGDDTLIGGLNGDLLRGQGGSDKYQYNSVDECGDQVGGFAANDFFTFKAAAFGFTKKGSLANKAFWSSNDGLAHDANDRFIFKKSDSTLWFDADGDAAGAPVLVADLITPFSVQAADILIV